MKVYRIKTSNILDQMTGDILCVGVVLFAFYKFFIFMMEEVNWISILIAISGLIIPGVSILGYSLSVNYNHYKYDKSTCLTIDSKNKKIFYKSQEISKDFLISDIDIILEYKPRVPMFPFRYYGIILKDKSNIKITSLVMPNLNKDLKKIPREQYSTYDLYIYRR